MTLPQVADIYERGISLGVMSKAYGLPGIRVGWVACRDPEALRRMERMKHYTSICGAAPSELLARIALKAREPILARNRALIVRNLAMFDAFFAEYSDLFEWYLPDGGCIGFPRYLGREGVEEFARRLVEQSGVLLLPSSVYESDLGATPMDRFRIGYGRDNMEAGLAPLRAHLRKRGVTSFRGVERRRTRSRRSSRYTGLHVLRLRHRTRGHGTFGGSVGSQRRHSRRVSLRPRPYVDVTSSERRNRDFLDSRLSKIVSLIGDGFLAIFKPAEA